MKKKLNAQKFLKYSQEVHTFKNDITLLIRLYVDGYISESDYRNNLSLICDNYRKFRKEHLLCVEL
ncbi:hypothetical protein [Microvirus mar38]|uniref:Uncharacterized protein n=1 Tax=Microvirus mar38 TaxID=2851172 RepID=A0A8F5XUB2_9VIRU|nr:hypothetical protein [Microvirus mar38]